MTTVLRSLTVSTASACRCAQCGQVWSGNHTCPILRPTSTWTTITPLGWTCPVCGAGVAPWKADHCRPKDEP